MILPVYEKGTVLYGNSGKYKLLKKEGNIITYEFEPWDSKSVFDRSIEKKTLNELSELMHIRILWACWEDQ